MTKQWLLVSFDNDWADEMNVCGFSIFEKKAWENVIVTINNHPDWPEEVGFGTNESNEYDNAEQLIKAYEVQKITESDRNILIKLFRMDTKNSEWGNFPAPWETWDTDDWENPDTENESKHGDKIDEQMGNGEF